MVIGLLRDALDSVPRPPGGGLQRRRAAPPRLRGSTGRPAVFSLLFWALLAASYGSWALGLIDVGRRPGFPAATMGAGILATAWLLLPWTPRAAGWQRLAAPAFLAAAAGVGQLFGGVWGALAFYPLAVANGMFLFGFRRGIAYAGAILAVVIGHAVASGEILGNAVFIIVVYAALAAFFAGVSAAILEADARREQTQALLAQLEHTHARLASAYAELEGYALRVRELTLAEERTRMAREMHDSVGHYLTAVNFQLEVAAKHAGAEQSAAAMPLARARVLANEAFLEVRRSVRALGPPAAGERSGAGAMAALARTFEGTGLEVRFAVEGGERDLPAGVELALYRALQEALSNAARHAGARLVRAALVYGPTSAKLVVADDGRGVPDAPGALHGGFGLAALKERAEGLGGTFAAANLPAGGFAVELELPLPGPERAR